jgi:hypothetical protein
MPPSFFSRPSQQDAAAQGPKPPAMLSALMKMPGVGESIAQFGAFASGIMETLKRHEGGLIHLIKQQEQILSNQKEILNLLGYAAEPAKEREGAIVPGETVDGE